ncbi:MAG: DUF2510 domain-containing protein [Acidimicrobiales bacterium]
MTSQVLGAALFAGYSRGEVVVSLVFACVFAGLGYRMSYRHRLTRGVTPWRLPSAIWALICFFLQPFGIIVEILAQATTKSAYPSPSPSPTVQAHAGTRPYGVFPVAPPAGVAGPQLTETPPAPKGPAPPASDVEGKPAMFGWYPDVMRRHTERYWDGRGWTDLVRDDGVSGSDPI